MLVLAAFVLSVASAAYCLLWSKRTWVSLCVGGFLAIAAYVCLLGLVVNGAAGCWPWSPSIVTYRAGMTLCPGQSVVVYFDVEL